MVQAAAEAHRLHMPPEHLVVALKAVLDSVTGDAASGAPDRSELWNELLQRMLVVYFTDPRD